jgi:hypothetical protein
MLAAFFFSAEGIFLRWFFQLYLIDSFPFLHYTHIHNIKSEVIIFVPIAH